MGYTKEKQLKRGIIRKVSIFLKIKISNKYTPTAGNPCSAEKRTPVWPAELTKLKRIEK